MGIDPTQDPEMAEAVRMSMQEEAAKAMSLEEPLNDEPPEGEGHTIRLRMPDGG